MSIICILCLISDLYLFCILTHGIAGEGNGREHNSLDENNYRSFWTLHKAKVDQSVLSHRESSLPLKQYSCTFAIILSEVISGKWRGGAGHSGQSGMGAFSSSYLAFLHLLPFFNQLLLFISGAVPVPAQPARPAAGCGAGEDKKAFCHF